jgi:2-oxo-4-hydroxy-4-carboxy-5-ureidoimidazoline decarboxylase
VSSNPVDADRRAPGLARLNDADEAQARVDLAACCASTRWVERVMAGRPYDTDVALLSASDHALTALDWTDVLEALAAHPRIGSAPTGTGREAAWSRQEQAAAAGDTAPEEFVAANREYEQRFDWVFLVCATGRSRDELLADLRSRLGNDPATEQDVVRRELAAIVRLRLGKMLG